MSEPNKILELKGLGKNFGAVKALSNVDFELYENEILALLGDNGAGKSTIVKILSGYYQPDAGRMTMKGEDVQFENPHVARDHGIETIYQDPSFSRKIKI